VKFRTLKLLGLGDLNIHKALYRIIFVCVILAVAVYGRAADTLSLDEYLTVISQNYPLVKKADLYDEFTEAYAVKGRGAFDPKIGSNFQAKNFSDENYYRIWHTEATIPTRYPIDFSVGYERNDGSFLNAENNVPNHGLLYGSINLSLVRGLMFDEQRYHMQVAELRGAKSQIEQDILTREIIFQAINTYLDWTITHEQRLIVENYLSTIQVRHQNIIRLFENGDKPSIDTIESRLNLNTATKILLETSRELIIKQQKLSLFLWDDAGNPLTAPDSISPEPLSDLLDRLDQISEIQNPQFVNDPTIRKIENQIDLLATKNRLERENLKPQIDLKYNALVNVGKEQVEPSLNLNDYKFGVKVEVPIRNRKTRGELRLNEILVEQARLDQSQYQQQLYIKYEGLMRSRSIQENVVDVAGEKIFNSTALYEAETLKFDLGESSVFLLNQRELKLLEAQMELIKSYKFLGSILSDLYYLKLGQ